MTKRKAFIGRKNELSRLRDTQKKHIASFIVAKGRRRIGKSRLIDEFSKSFDHYYKFEGLAPDSGMTFEAQLNEFCNQISRQFNSPKAIYQDWSDAFWAVGERVQQGKILLFFDEISWMADKSPTFLAKLKSFWDNSLTNNPDLVFVICSSASSWVEKNLLSSTGFVGRISFTLTLEELPLSDCKQFWPKKISAYEKFKVLAITGGIPKYLEEVNPSYSAEENIKQLCFMSGSLLANEFHRIFSDLFMRESKFYEKIIHILATGPKEQTEIQQKMNSSCNAQQYGRIPEYLWELEEAGFIRRDYSWNIATGTDTKRSRYRLQDNYLRFYLKYIEKNLAKIKRGAFTLKSLTALPAWNTVMGLQFENLILNNRSAIHHLLKINADEIINDNPYYQTTTLRRQGCQIDYMIQTKFNSLYICEIKFSRNLISTSIIKAMEQKINHLKYPKGFSCRPVLIHINGVTEELIDTGYFANIIDMSELL